jgi:hypothetical protein
MKTNKELLEEQKILKEQELQRDRELVIKLRRVTRPIQSEMDEIYTLYKKYIDKDAPMYCPSCNGSGYNSIQKYWMRIINLSI